MPPSDTVNRRIVLAERPLGLIFDHYASRFDAFREEMAAWVDAGKVKVHEDVVDGLENAPNAFIGLLQGRNFGKLVVRVTDI